MWESIVTGWDSFVAGSGVVLLWITSVILILVGIVGCIMPYPGHLFVLLGCVAAAFAKGEPCPAWWVWGLVTVLGLFGFLVDNVTTAMGAKRFGSSKSAIVCSILGLLIGGIFLFPMGLFVGPFIGAFAAELFLARKTAKQATRSGLGAALGVMAGFVGKLLFAGAMLAVFFLLG